MQNNIIKKILVLSVFCLTFGSWTFGQDRSMTLSLVEATEPGNGAGLATDCDNNQICFNLIGVPSANLVGYQVANYDIWLSTTGGLPINATIPITSETSRIAFNTNDLEGNIGNMRVGVTDAGGDPIDFVAGENVLHNFCISYNNLAELQLAITAASTGLPGGSSMAASIDGDPSTTINVYLTEAILEMNSNTISCIRNVQPPELSGLPDDECNKFTEAEVTAFDFCRDNFTNVQYQIDTVACDDGIVITRTWTAHDDCGNVTSESRVSVFDDHTPPQLFRLPEDETLHCGRLPAPAEIFAVDGCSKTYVEVEDDLVEETEGYEVWHRIFTGFDLCGNSASHTQTITIITESDLQGEISIGDLIICTSDENFASIEVEGGTGTLSYEWSILGPNSYILTSPNKPSVKFKIGFGDVTLVVNITDEEGCMITRQASVLCDKRIENHNRNGSLEGSQESFKYIGHYPDPVTTEVTIEIESRENIEAASIVLFDMSGKRIESSTIDLSEGLHPYEVSTRNLPAGVYSVLIEEQGSAAIFRFVKVN